MGEEHKASCIVTAQKFCCALNTAAMGNQASFEHISDHACASINVIWGLKYEGFVTRLCRATWKVGHGSVALCCVRSTRVGTGMLTIRVRLCVHHSEAHEILELVTVILVHNRMLPYWNALHKGGASVACHPNIASPEQ